MTTVLPSDRRHRMSLTWRVIFLSSLLLLALATLFTWLGHDTLVRQFQASRDDHTERQRREIALALSRSEESLQQLAGVTAASPNLGTALEMDQEQAIQTALASQWPTLQIEAGIEEILIFDMAGNSLATLGGHQQTSDAPIRDWVQQVIATETPLTDLRCWSDCYQYAAAPILVEGESVGMVIVTRSLADVTRHAQQVSGSDIGLLVTAPEDEAPPAAEMRRLPEWSSHLTTLTHQQATLPLLQEASRQITLEALLQAPYRLEYEDRQIELSAVQLAEEGNESSSYFLLLSDITESLAAIDRDTRTLLIAGLGGWMTAELMLLFILWQPMVRLRRLALVLPELAKGGFASTRDRIPLPRRRLSDEIDVLEDTTLELSHQLETLQQEVQLRGEQLAVRLEELGQERDFVGSILDTAHALILTQDDQGLITLVNDYALGLLGQSETLLLGRHFDEVFPPEYRLLPTSLEESPPQDERTLQTLEGQRIIVWYHSPLAATHSPSLARISVGLDITERKYAESRLTWFAHRDPLTELYNRRFFQEALDQALIRGGHGVVMFMDLDHFRGVNELSGHHAGDQLLRLVAHNLLQEIGHQAVIARLGGDEFSFLFEGIDADQAVQTAKQIDKLMDDISLHLDGRCHRANASIGIACYPAHGDNPTDLMASADVAMYKAKESGVQRWHLLATLEHTKDELKERVYWVERLRTALQEDKFALMVQPIVRLSDLDTRHYEVLLRMRDEDGSLISPGRFIPVAERSGQIIQLDRWVLRHSLKALQTIQHKGISLAVNLSGQSLHDSGLKQFLIDELAATGADPRHLILEVTETAAVTDFSTARGVIQAMRDLGCRTALDDFGVGFSSFHYLSQMPVDYIKIDGSFIRNLAHNAESRVIVRAIADMAKDFGKQAIAEFVEEEALLALLQSYGIEYGQGYHLGRPMLMETAFFEDAVKGH
ncbi:MULTISPECIES: EAL domain-containing protein [Halomonadaceae]|uniref:bifunctional diguanylate cyclase/phosphodiesterase n=1 Tax=Halomonadaceae TaxID=28256 RepID=UPI001597670E|nr:MULTISPECIES: EAL domain-containing protein [Halomonas]QJQ96298.1 EAL domain-containing protein [Halomonas sp. PA5]